MCVLCFAGMKRRRGVLSHKMKRVAQIDSQLGIVFGPNFIERLTSTHKKSRIYALEINKI